MEDEGQGEVHLEKVKEKRGSRTKSARNKINQKTKMV